MWVADKLYYRGNDNFIRAYQGSILVWEKYKNDRIFYTSTDGQVVTPYRNGRGGTGDDYTAGFGARITSNTYNGGSGLIKFNGDVTKVKFGFTGCSTLRTVTLPSSVTEIGTSAFDGCTGLVSVNIPNGVTSIGWLAFYGCTSLVTIEIPASVTSIGDDAFRECNALKTVYVDAVIPPSLGNNVFLNNASGRLIKVPAASVQAYKTASGWSSYASSIVAQ